MKIWIRRATALYPRSWRRRYGAEFEALLDEADAGPRELVDVIQGALKMQLLKLDYWKLTAGMALAGALIAAAISFASPENYVATAALRTSDAGLTTQALGEVLSRSSLSEIIQRPSLDLYRRERQRIPMEDVIEKMRTRDIRVRQSGPDLRISFAYPDPEKAGAVTRALADRLIAGEQRYILFQAKAWHDIWPQAPPPPSALVEVVDPAALSAQPVAPNRLAWIAIGLTAGLIIGLLAAAATRRPLWARRLAVCAAAGCALGAAVSFLLPETYISNAVMFFTMPVVPENPNAPALSGPSAERLDALQREVLSRESLAELIRRPRLNLYSELRAKQPIEDVVAHLRQHISIEMVGPSAFRISFAHSNPQTSQAVARELVSQFVEREATDARNRVNGLNENDTRYKILEHRGGSALEVIDAASLPQSPAAPNRSVVTAFGVVIGLMLGALTFRSPRPPLPESC